MNIEESKKILDKFVTEHKLFNIKHSDGLEEAIETLLTAYEKEKEKNSKIDEFCRKELAFKRRLQRENRQPDEFNQGRFYVSENRQPDEFNQGRFYVSENIRKIIEEE